jgi:hypothetical protein
VFWGCDHDGVPLVLQEPLLAIDLKVGGPAVELPCTKAVQGLVTVSIDDEGKDMRV